MFNKRIFINKHFKYIIKNILNKKNNKVNLIIINIIIIKGFYINIIFKALLYKKGNIIL